MKIAKKLLCLLMAVVMLGSILTVYGSAVVIIAKNKYPIILVHGMFGWGANEGINDIVPYYGATAGDLVGDMRKKGYDCYSASVGPLSSVWDQACELYAQLTGTKVDYGVLHSKEIGHDRYGREYAEPLFRGWSPDHKIHLVAHSFGGNAARLLTYLLTYGDEAEMNACDNPSPLFEGGHGDLVASCTALCSPLNGTTAYNFQAKLGLMKPLKTFVTLWATVFGRSIFNGTIVDFHLEQFGVSAVPGEKQNKSAAKAFKEFMNSNDSVESLLSLKDCKEFNDKIEPTESVYYFSLAYDCTKDTFFGRMPLSADFFLLAIFAKCMINLGEFTDKDTGIVCDKSWYPNDGLVNVISAQYPFDEPHKDFDKNSIEQGVWNVMPTRTGDHGTPIGLFADQTETYDLYIELFDMLISVE